MICVDDHDGSGARGQQPASDIRDAVVSAAHGERASCGQVVQKKSRQIAPLARGLIVRRHPAFRGHIPRRIRVLEHERLKILGRKRVNDDVAFRACRVEARTGIVVPLDAEHVASAAYIAQLRAIRRVVPQRHRALLYHEHLMAVRLPLPEDVFVGLVKLHASAARERKKV